MLELRNVAGRAGREWAVWDVTCEVPPSSIAAFAGPVGAGKTTLLRVLAGLSIGQGEAYLDDVDLVADPGWARMRTGFVADDDGFYEEMEVGEYLAFIAACQGIGAADRAPLVADLLDVVSLAERRTAPVAALSRGMRRRLALARALLPDPDVLLLDEPAAGLDPLSWAEIQDVFRQLRALGKSVLFTCADVGDASDVATHVGVINGGRLVVFGTLRDLLAHAQRSRFIRVRVAGDPEPAAALLRGLPLVTAVSAEGPVLHVAYLGGDGTAHAVLTALVRGGQPVLTFEEDRGGLAEVYRRAVGG